jgi:hypothetical protein
MLTREQSWLWLIVLAQAAVFVVAFAVGLSTSTTHSSMGWYAIGLMCLIGAINVSAFYLMSGEIGRNYPDLYNEIGRPAMSTDRSTNKQHWRFFMFVLTRKYASVGSRKIRLLGDVFWLSTIANYFLILYLAVFHQNDFHN